MGLFDELSKALTPHSKRLNENIGFQGALLHRKLHAIEHAVHDLGRGDIGDHWQRFVIKRKFGANEQVEVMLCPINEIFLIQAISSDGVQEKSPAYVLEANGVLLESVIKEGLGFEGIGGNQVVLPGETLTITARAEGNINCVVTVIRRPYPGIKITTEFGRDSDQYSHRNVHETARDVIASKTDIYTEPVAEIDPTRGRHDIAHQELIRPGK
jgi:hypothetical protein